VTTRSSEYAMQSLAKCPKCRRWLHVSLFQRSAARKRGIQAHCRTCHNETMRARRKIRKEQPHG